LEFSPDKARYSAPVEPRVAQASQIQMASRAVEKTIMGLKTQQISAAGAMQELQKTQALLLSQGRTQEAQEVTMALRALQSGDAGAAEKTLMGTMVNLDQGKV
jgi:Ca-activated chloride channel family protein